MDATTMKRLLLPLAILVCVFLGFSVSFTPGRAARLVDDEGRPVVGAYVFAIHRAAPKLFFPLAYWDGTFTRTDGTGRFSILLKIHFRMPFLQFFFPVTLWIATYAPGLHNYCSIDDAGRWRISPPCEGRSVRITNPPEGPVIALRDMRERPDYRFDALWQLIYAMPILEVNGPQAEKAELVSRVRKEFDLFASQYGSLLWEKRRDSPVRKKVDDWIQDDGQGKPWDFFLRQVPWSGSPMEQKLSEIERRLRQPDAP
jgi:hypothetical protein